MAYLTSDSWDSGILLLKFLEASKPWLSRKILEVLSNTLKVEVEFSARTCVSRNCSPKLKEVFRREKAGCQQT